MLEIILNLKQVRFKKALDDDIQNEKIYISLKNTTQFTAEDIEKHTTSFRVTNPEMLICEMENFVNLEVELTIEKGRGYLPAEDNEPKDASTGTISHRCHLHANQKCAL